MKSSISTNWITDPNALIILTRKKLFQLLGKQFLNKENFFGIPKKIQFLLILHWLFVHCAVQLILQELKLISYGRHFQIRNQRITFFFSRKY